MTFLKDVLTHLASSPDAGDNADHAAEYHNFDFFLIHLWQGIWLATELGS
jgi:hypothetical protein